MRRYSPPYYSPPRRGYGGRPRSPPPRRGGYGGYGGDRGRPKEQNNGSLLVRNIPLDCRSEELRVPFERFGVVRDVYLPKDYYTGEPRGFAFVQFVDPYEAAEAQYHMNGQIFAGREITVVLAAETRKRPEEMRRKTRSGGSVSHGGRRSYHGHSRSRSRSPPRYPSGSRSRHRSRSYSPAPRRSNYSPSPDRRESDYPRSSRDRGLERERVHYSRKDEHDYEETHGAASPSPGRATRSPSGSRSRSRSRSRSVDDISPRR